jgi:putative salt-induced outer membrane protein YdiY
MNQAHTRGEDNILKMSHTVRTVSSLLLLGMIMGINPAAMAEGSQNAVPVTDEAKEAWTPPPPPPDEFDWIQLNSGEWLKGEFKVLYDDSVEFDSDELGLLSLDWADIKQVRGAAAFAVNIEGRDDVVGNLQVDGDRIMIVADEETQEFNRADVISIAHGAPKESNYWSAKFSLGLNISQGNSDKQDLNLALNTKRRTADTRFLTDYLGFYSKSDHIKTDDNHRLRSTYDIFKTRQFFWRPLLGEVFRDPFQNIDYQITVGAGAGYQLIDNSKTEWSIQGGPAFKYTKFDTVEDGENKSESTPALWAGTNYDRALNGKMDLILGYSTVIGNQDSGGYTHHAIATLETELLSWLDFDTSFIWDHIQNPTRDSDGSIPDKNDYRFVIGLGVDY